jgi:hypothetical protein
MKFYDTGSTVLQYSIFDACDQRVLLKDIRRLNHRCCYLIMIDIKGHELWFPIASMSSFHFYLSRLLGWNPSLIDDEDDDDTTNSLITVLERPVRFSDFALQYLTITQ